RGYTVLSVNYRSGTGYGQAFREAPGIARDGASEYRDVLAGGRWLATRKDIDPQKIGIWGGSWGGYLTALALARDSTLFKAGADFHGV
ncbi:prolyl oligopeptidase family serine peptidase, partial [Klebsiella michiganensis]|nr:prolyl oligopeptidase family serine peptidase [Klebsiella michiganensis]